MECSTIDESQSKKLEDSHPAAYAVYKNIKSPGMVEKYLMGRQLCVIAIVFLISQLTSFPSMPPLLPTAMQNIMIETGLPGVMVTLIIGQLFPQLIADEYTIRFLNIRGSLFFIQVAEFLEGVGLFTNCSWVVSYALAHFVFRWGVKGVPEGDVENPLDALDIGASTHNLLLKLQGSYSARSDGSADDVSEGGRSDCDSERGVEGEQRKSNLSRYGRYHTAPSSPHLHSGESLALNITTTATELSMRQLDPSTSGLLSCSSTLVKLIVSTVFTVVAAAIVVYGICYQRPLLSLHPLILLALLLVCMVFEFYLEGLQVAVLATQHRDPASIPASLTGAMKIHQFICRDKKEEVVKRFLIGRQFLVVFSMFTVASITSFESYDHFNQDLIPRKLVGLFVLTGFCGVVFALNTVQLPAQILAKQYPLMFLNLPCAHLFLHITLLVEQSGIMHFGWTMFHCSKRMFQYD